MDRSWVLTSAGVITAAGDTAGALFSALVSGVPLTACAGPPSEGLPVAPLTSFDPKSYLKRKGLKDLSRLSQLACAAASGVAPSVSAIPGERVGVAFGSAWGSVKTVIAFERAAHVDGPRFVDPLLFTETVGNVPAGQISIFFGWSAFNGTVSSGTGSGLEAICWAVDLLEEGRARVAIAGGGDELNLPLLRALRAEDKTAHTKESFPYGEGRSGPIGGEGACLVTIEAEEEARLRGAVPLACLRAAGGSFAGRDGGRGDGPRRARASEMLRDVLDRARLAPGDVDLLVLSANGSATADAEEASAIVDVFGDGAAAPPAIAPKGILGETWAASGPIAIVAALEAIRTGIVPGRARGFTPARDLARVNLPPETERRRVTNALIFDCAWRGQLSAVLLSATGDARGA